MVLVRLAYVADLPVPAELVRSLAGASAAGGRPTNEAAYRPPVNRGEGAEPSPAALPVATSAASTVIGSLAAARVEPDELAAPTTTSSVEYDPMPQSFAEVVALFDKRREAVIGAQLREYVHLIAFEPGRIEFRPADAAPSNLANRISRLLSEWTGERWLVARSPADPGEPTLRQQEERRDRDMRNAVERHPLVQAVFETFPGATIAAVRERFLPAGSAADDPPPELDPADETISEEDGT